MKNIMYTTFVLLTLFLSACSTTTSSMKLVKESDINDIFTMERSALFENAIAAVNQAEWILIDAKKDEGIIRARTHMTMLTKGDIIHIQVLSADKGKNRVIVTSSTGQAHDWGKGAENIKTYYSILNTLVN